AHDVGEVVGDGVAVEGGAAVDGVEALGGAFVDERHGFLEVVAEDLVDGGAVLPGVGFVLPDLDAREGGVGLQPLLTGVGGHGDAGIGAVDRDLEHLLALGAVHERGVDERHQGV
ncbi:hypothetical protein Tdes44962_MAKER09819, partial [Teratosphaeria destructans]